MRENEKRAGTAESFSPKTLLMIKMVFLQIVVWDLYATQNNKNYQNEQKLLTITWIKWEEIKRRYKSQKAQEGEQWQGQGNFAATANGYENSQGLHCLSSSNF